MRTCPADIEILLRFYWSPEADEFGWAGDSRERIAEFVKMGLLTTTLGRVRGNHEALEPYVNALCEIPLPEQRWVLPDR